MIMKNNDASTANPTIIIRRKNKNQKLNRTHEPLLNRELVDLNNIPISEKDFLEGIFVFTKSVDESLKDLLNNINTKN